MMVYAGIGNRTISEATFDWLEQVGLFLSKKGWLLRSGSASGSDSAFQCGSRGRYISYVSEDATPEAVTLASQYHPAWDRCNESSRKLHGRNAMILFGDKLDFPVKFVICYAKDENEGGTALGIRIARAHNIPVFNMFNNKDYSTFVEFIASFK